MDYHSLPRKQLQVLCKKHGIPANAANSEMADALTTLLKPKPQLHAENSKQPEKRSTRSREPALSGTVSKSKDVEEESNMKLQKANNSHKTMEEISNRKPQRVTRGRGSAIAVSEAPKSAALKTEKTPTNSETETNSIKQQETRKVSTRNGASKLSNREMPTNVEENVDSMAATSPKLDKKKEKAGGIVLRRGRVKLRSPGNLSKSPELAKITEEVGVGMLSSQSCLANAKRNKKKKRSVTFSDVLEINCASIEDTSRGCVSENIEEPAKETMAEIQKGTDSNLPKNINSACMAKKVIGTRKVSRGVSSDVIAAPAGHKKSSKELVAKVSKAEGFHTYDAEKNANVEIGGESDRKRAVRAKKILNSVGEAAAKENEVVVKVVDGFVKGDHVEDVPCTRRSRRLTIAPTDVKSKHDRQLATESKGHHESLSIASNKTESDLPAETSRRSRRKTLAVLEPNQVQSSVGSASVQVEKKVSKAEGTQSKNFKSELKGEALNSQQHSEIETCSSIPIANEADVQPIKMKEALSARNLRGYRPKALVTSTDQCITSAEEVSIEMGYHNICSTEITSGKVVNNVDTTESEKVHSQAALSTTILANSEPDSLQEVTNDAKPEVQKSKTSVMPRSTKKISEVSHSKEVPSTRILANSEPDSLQEVINDAKPGGQISKTTSVMPRSTKETSEVSIELDNGTAVSQEPASNTQVSRAEQEGILIVDKVAGKNIQEFKDLNVIAQTGNEQSEENLILKNHNVPRDEDPVSSTPSNEDMNRSDSFSCALQIVIREGGERQHQISEDANSISCNAELEYDACLINVRSPSTTAILCEAGDSVTANSSPLVNTVSIKPDAAAAVQNQQFTEGTSSAISPQCMLSRNEVSIENNHDVIEQESRATSPPVSTMIQDNHSQDGSHDVNGVDLKNSIEIHSSKDITAHSPAALVESTSEHQISIDIVATAEHEACTLKVQLLTSDKDKFANMRSGGAADMIEQQPVDSNLCEEDSVDKVEIKVHGDLQKEQLQDTNEGVPYNGVKGVIEQEGHATSPECALSKHDVPFKKDHDVTEQNGNAMDESATIGSLTMDKKSRSNSPVSSNIKDNGSLHGNDHMNGMDVEDNGSLHGNDHMNGIDLKDNGSLHGNHFINGIDLEDSIEIHTNKDITVSSPASIEKDHDVIQQEGHATSPECVLTRHEFTNEKDHDLIEQKGNVIDELSTIISLTKDSKSRSNSPVSTMIQDNDSLHGIHYINDIDLENSIEIHTDKGFTDSSPARISIDIATAEHLLTSGKDKFANMASGGAADLVEQQPIQAVDSSLCEEDTVDKVEIKVHDGDTQKEQLQDSNEGVLYDGVKGADDRSTPNDQLRQFSPLLPSCSAEPESALPRESAHKTMQRRPRSIYKSARKAKFLLPWENISLEETAAPHPNQEATLNSLDQVERNAEVWGLNNHEMTCNEIDSASSEDEESCAETEETLSDTEETLSDTQVCNFDTERLISNTEGDYSCSEHDTPSESEKDTMFDSEEYFSEMEGELLRSEDYFSEMEGELPSGEESYESEEQETSEEELSESEDDEVDDFEEYEVSPVPKSVTISGSDNALCLTHGLEDQQAEIIAASKSSLQNDGAMQAETINHLALENNTYGFAPNVETTDIDQKVGEQHEELQKVLSTHAVTEIQENVDVLMTYNDNIAIGRVQSASDSTCQDSDSLASLFSSPPSKVKEHSVAGPPAIVDCLIASPMLDNVEKSQLLESNSNNAFLSDKENEQMHTSASELPCICPSKLILENIGVESGDSVICEEVSLNWKNVQEVQEEPYSLKIDQFFFSGIEEDNAGNKEVKNELENKEGSVGMAPDAQNGSEDLRELLDLEEGTISELTEKVMITEVATFGSSTLALNDELKEMETATEHDLQILHLDNGFTLDDLSQKQNTEVALAFDTAYIAIGTTVLEESAKEPELDMVTDDKIHLFSSSTSCILLEKGEPLLQHECEQDLLSSDASEQSKAEAIGEEPEVIQSESYSESLMDSESFEVDHCSTPKRSDDSGIAPVFIHECLNEVAQTMICVEIESINAQVEEVHEENVDVSQSSEESKKDKETAAADNLISEISKEQSMKQIDLTLCSVRELRKMCKGNLMSAKKKTENETPVRTPSRLWMSATKQVHQPNTSMHPKELPSANKRSALKALSSNIKATTPSAAMQTPTAKGSQRPRNLMSNHDGSDGTGKHLVTPSPQAPMSSKRDFARSHHR